MKSKSKLIASFILLQIDVWCLPCRGSTMRELEGGRIGQPCEKLSPLHLLVPSIDVKTMFLGSSRLAAHGGGRLASQIVLLHEIFCFWCHALVTRDKAVNAPPTPLPWCSPARFIGRRPLAKNFMVSGSTPPKLCRKC